MATRTPLQLRVCKVKRGGKTHKYAQFVQSYRRKDGMPVKRVVAGLGELPDETVANLRAALKASREGKTLVVADEQEGLTDRSRVKANLRYLDLAVVLEMWRSWGLDDLVTRALGGGADATRGSDVVLGLTVQRAVAPGSKLLAERWFPTTAMPELLGFTGFNNSRIHRVMARLHRATPELQFRLAERYRKRDTGSPAFFIDLTNTYFHGRGCELAERTRTKEGIPNKRAIGIVLLADRHGRPVRWEVLGGKTKDHTAMEDMVDRVKGVDWLQGAPVVFDRAMGREATLKRLLDSGLHFLTAAPVTTIGSHTDEVPHGEFADQAMVDGPGYEEEVRLATRTARRIGMEEVDGSLFVKDLGLGGFLNRADAKGPESRGGGKGARPDVGARIRYARLLRRKLDEGECGSQAALARATGVAPQTVRNSLALLRLAPEILARLETRPTGIRVPVGRLLEAARESDHGRQHRMLADLLDGPAGEPSPRLRLLTYFNPAMFVDQRRRARKHLRELQRFVADLNAELARARRSREEEPTRRKIARKLEGLGYSDAFELSLDPIEVTSVKGTKLRSFRCRLVLKPKEWARRRRYDGFVLLLGHPDLSRTARELALLYREKDVVEKDFQTIKSVVAIRPIYSHTDPKVQAHVTVCMLALLLHRTLERRLREADIALSPKAVLEILGTCHLNLMDRTLAGHAVYSVTEPTAAQREIVEALGLAHLLEDADVAARLTPR